MTLAEIKKKPDFHPGFPDNISLELTQDDEQNFLSVISTQLNSMQISNVINPGNVYSRERSILAIHWHPEFIPMDLIRQRFENTFPNRTDELIIPTQHNQILTFDDRFYGVEVDAYSSGFNQKVQLLIHFYADNLGKTDVFKAMLLHTFKYRSSQLFDFIYTIIKPDESRINEAADETGADEKLIRFVKIYVKKINDLIEKHYDDIPPESIKNKILRNFFDTLRLQYSQGLINRAQNYLQSVKRIVKRNFDLKYFYKTEEIIEEARSFGAGIVIPHPEQFWPILLADYDIDGIEVWNPQSRRYTDFLISVIDRTNAKMSPAKKRLLVFMGDDTHMSEKVRDLSDSDKLKELREIGVQDAWNDLSIQKKLMVAKMDKQSVIQEYRGRLSG